MSRPTIFADFNNADARGHVRLNCVGTIRDLADKGLVLREGLPLILSDDDSLEADGEAHFDEEDRLWVARINWSAIREVDERAETRPLANGTSRSPVANERNLG